MVRFVTEAVRQLHGLPEPEDVARRLAAVLVPVLADVAAVRLDARGSHGTLVCATADPAAEPGVRAALAEHAPALERLRERCRSTGPTPGRWLAHAANAAQRRRFVAGDAGVERLLDALAPASLVVLPLCAGERSLGVMVLAHRESGRRYGGVDLAAAQALAHRAALALDSARLAAEVAAETRRRERAEERMRAAQRLEAVGRLAGGMAHEVNNMMTVILGFSEFVMRAPDLPEAHATDLARIRAAATRAAEITRELLAFSRQQVLRTQVLHIDEFVAAALDRLCPLLPADVRTERRLGAPGARVAVDPGQFEQVLVNLVFNARDAMPGGGGLIVETTVRGLASEPALRELGLEPAPGPFAVLCVRDTGVGMDEPTRNHVFEPFFTTKAQGKGTGLGLASVYGIVKQSGGYVWVDSAEGEGTVFTVALPLAEPAPPGPEAAGRGGRSETDDLAPAGGPSRGTVLVVEDEPGVRLLVIRSLAAAGYRTLEADDGTSALALVERTGGGIDLVLTDVVMPGMGGRELRDRLAAVRPLLPVLFMSAYPRDEVLQRGLVGSGDRFLQKPFTPAQLARGVGEALEAAGVERR